MVAARAFEAWRWGCVETAKQNIVGLCVCVSGAPTHHRMRVGMQPDGTVVCATFVSSSRFQTVMSCGREESERVLRDQLFSALRTGEAQTPRVLAIRRARRVAPVLIESRITCDPADSSPGRWSPSQSGCRREGTRQTTCTTSEGPTGPACAMRTARR